MGSALQCIWYAQWDFIGEKHSVLCKQLSVGESSLLRDGCVCLLPYISTGTPLALLCTLPQHLWVLKCTSPVVFGRHCFLCVVHSLWLLLFHCLLLSSMSFEGRDSIKTFHWTLSYKVSSSAQCPVSTSSHTLQDEASLMMNKIWIYGYRMFLGVFSWLCSLSPWTIQPQILGFQKSASFYLMDHALNSTR